MAKPGTRPLIGAHHEVLVGIHEPTSTVARIFVRNDGALVGLGRTFHPAEYRPAGQDVNTASGLTEVRRFSLRSKLATDEYAAELERRLEAGRMAPGQT